MLCHKCNAEIADNAILCDACGAVVKTTPAPVEDETVIEQRCRRINIRRLIAFALAAAVLLVGIGGMLIYNSADVVATRFVKANLEGDFVTMLGLTVGDMQDLLEQETSEANRDHLFSQAVYTAGELGLDVTVSNWKQCYTVLKQIVKTAYSDTYGEDYTIKVTVNESEDMGVKELDLVRASYQEDTYASYVDVAQIKDGKYVTVTVVIDGYKANNTFERVLPLVRYKGAWRVVASPYSIF